ncbi:hypothetical protein D3C76_1498400 [compost metagenome]
MVYVKHGVPVNMVVYYLNEAGKVKTADQLTDAEKAVKAEIENTSNLYSLHKYGYKPAAFGANDAEKLVSAKAVEAIKFALESAGK